MERLTEHWREYVRVYFSDTLYPVSYPEKSPMGKVALRLAAYEDSGLEPDVVKELGDHIHKSGERLLSALEHAQRLLEAEEAGRLVVLPVEPWLGPTQQNEMYIRENGAVWAIYVTGCEAGPNADGVFTVMYTTLDGDVFSADDIGQTVFLTRQEAEAAKGDAMPWMS